MTLDHPAPRELRHRASCQPTEDEPCTCGVLDAYLAHEDGRAESESMRTEIS